MKRRWQRVCAFARGGHDCAAVVVFTWSPRARSACDATQKRRAPRNPAPSTVLVTPGATAALDDDAAAAGLEEKGMVAVEGEEEEEEDEEKDEEKDEKEEKERVRLFIFASARRICSATSAVWKLRTGDLRRTTARSRDALAKDAWEILRVVSHER